MAKRGATRQAPEPEYNPKNVVVGGGIMASLVAGFLMWGGNGPRDIEPPQEKPEAQFIITTTPTQAAIATAPSYTVQNAKPATQPITAGRAVTTNKPAVVTETATAVKTKKTTPAPASSVQRTAGNSPLPVLVGSDKKTGSETWRIAGYNYTLDKSTVRAFETHAKNRGWPKEMFISTCARESKCKPDAIALSTKACGLFQLMPTKDTQTLWRLTYMYGEANGYKAASELVERYRKPLHKNATDAQKEAYKKAPPIYLYKPKDNKADTTLMGLCMNADFNTAMFAEDKAREIREYETWLGNREMAIGEFVFINNLGVNRMKRFARQAWDDKASGENTMARAFFGKSISDQNPSLVKYPDERIPYIGADKKTHYKIKIGEDKTVRQSFNDIINNFGGWRSPAEVLSMNIN